MPQPCAPQPVVALVRDLMLASRISATARAKNIAVRMLKDPERLAESGGRLLLVDLGQAGAVDAAVTWKQLHGGRVIGFAAHVDARTIGEARSAGLDRVLPRGAFFGQLESILESG